MTQKFVTCDRGLFTNGFTWAEFTASSTALDRSEEAMNENLSTASTKRQPMPIPMVDARAGTPPRTVEEMEKEATWLQSLFEQ
jgi:hypothetical protein